MQAGQNYTTSAEMHKKCVGAAGFEPTTSCKTCKAALFYSYSPDNFKIPRFSLFGLAGLIARLRDASAADSQSLGA